MAQNENSIRKAIAQKQETPLFFAPVLERLMTALPERSRDILTARYGVSGAHSKTLEDIGRTYRITRERVRQVIGSALHILTEECGTQEMCTEISRRIKSTLEENSGIMKTEEFFHALAPQGGEERGALLVFLESVPGVVSEKATKEHEAVYVLKGFSIAEWKTLKDSAQAILTEAGHALEGDVLYARFREQGGAVEKKQFFDFLSIAKEVCQSVFGKWGRADWSDIRPRGTREKAYLVLKTAGKPLHFREIASLIDRYGLKNKKKRESHPQTVHNELIKDERFVLVGRGTYALAEWGYEKGTVKEVLENILRTAGTPLSRTQILEAMFKMRRVKKSTVIINLNTFFSRVGKDRYSLKK